MTEELNPWRCGHCGIFHHWCCVLVGPASNDIGCPGFDLCPRPEHRVDHDAVSVEDRLDASIIVSTGLTVPEQITALEERVKAYKMEARVARRALQIACENAEKMVTRKDELVSWCGSCIAYGSDCSESCPMMMQRTAIALALKEEA